MGTDKPTQVIMSTYNGERYIKEQLDSIVNQDIFSEIKILIRDDGSTDGTANILKNYQNKYGIDVILGKNIGVTKSFYELFSACDLNCKYFAISDQDDVWLPFKMEKALSFLSAFDENKPAMFSSISCVTDENLSPLGYTVDPKRGVSFYNAMIQNVCPGHTQVFNKALLLELQKCHDERIKSIDHWIYLIAAAIGNIYFCNESTVLHRQHHGNAVGYQTNFLKKFIIRLRRLKLKEPDSMTLQLKAFFELYSETVTGECMDEAGLFLSSTVFSERLKYALNTKCFRQSRLDTMLFKLLFIIGKYHL